MVMEIFYVKVGYRTRWQDDFSACIGYFDGLHLGHQALLHKTLELAEKTQSKAAIITFEPDPWETIFEKKYQHLTTMKDRIEMAKTMGFDYFIILTFNKEMSALTGEQFYQRILKTMPLKHLVCGFDFKYGYKGQGTIEQLKQQAKTFDITVIEQVKDGQEKISTTRIIEAINQGNVEEAHRLLGYPYRIRGVVGSGRKQGTKIGYPTANIDYHCEYIIPAEAVYVGELMLDNKTYPAMISIGHNPTFNQRIDLALEVHIFNFNRSIYGERVAVNFLHYLRPQIKFDYIDDLIQQLDQDKINSLAYFKEIKK